MIFSMKLHLLILFKKRSNYNVVLYLTQHQLIVTFYHSALFVQILLTVILLDLKGFVFFHFLHSTLKLLIIRNLYLLEASE